MGRPRSAGPMWSLTTDMDGRLPPARRGARTARAISPGIPGPPEGRPRGRRDPQRCRSWAIRIAGRARAWAAVVAGRCPGAEAVLAAGRAWWAKTFRLALRKWAAREAAR